MICTIPFRLWTTCHVVSHLLCLSIELFLYKWFRCSYLTSHICKTKLDRSFPFCQLCSLIFPFLSKLLSLRLSRPRAMRMFHPSKCKIMLSSSTSATESDYLIPLPLDLALFSKVIVRFYSSVSDRFNLPPNRFAGSLEAVEARYLSESDEGTLVSCPSLPSGLTESSGYDCLRCFH